MRTVNFEWLNAILMKRTLENLNEALTFHLENMYDAEKMLQRKLADFLPEISSPALKKEWTRYCNGTPDKRLKLKRIFSYLLSGPFHRKNPAMEEMLKELKEVSSMTKGPLRDVMLIATMDQIIQWKIAAYGTARALSMVMELQTVTELLEEIVQWEKEADAILSRIAEKHVDLKAGDTVATQ